MTITEHYRTVTVRTTTDGVESDEVQEIEEEVVELAPGVTDVDRIIQQRRLLFTDGVESDVQTRSDVQEQEKVLDDGTTVQTKVTITEEQYRKLRRKLSNWHLE